MSSIRIPKAWWDMLIVLAVIFLSIFTTLLVAGKYLILARGFFELALSLLLIGINEKAVYNYHGTYREWYDNILSVIGLFALLLSFVFEIIPSLRKLS